MNQLCVVFLVVGVVVCTILTVYSEVINKCCNSNYSFRKTNGEFRCSYKRSNKSHVFTNNTNFFRRRTDGQCVEFVDDFYTFNINQSVISQLQILDYKKVYSKCCPINFIYNGLTHGCEEVKNANYSDTKKSFIKVGLPTCEVIVDVIVANITDEFYNSTCTDRTKDGSFILRQCEEAKDVCSEMRCVQKCCPDGQTFLDKDDRQCIENYRGIDLHELTSRGALGFPDDDFAIVIPNNISNIFLLNESLYPSYVNRIGNYLYRVGNSSTVNRTSVNYCIEYVKSSNEYLFFCNKEENYIKKVRYIVPISITMLIITIFLYFLLNEVKKIFGKILVNYCLAILIWNAYSAHSPTGYNVCMGLGFIGIYGRYASFIWSNILCWHIWRTFGCMSLNNHTFTKDKYYKKFILYSLYGWGIPMVFTLPLFYTSTEKLPDVIQPHSVEDYCTLEIALHFRLPLLDVPITLLQIVNVVLFVKTVMYCLKVKSDINKINGSTDGKEHFKRNTAKLFLVLKLLLIMGVTFVSDTVIGTVLKEAPVFDSVYNVCTEINSAQGILIFIIFICNKQIYNSLKKKFGISKAGCCTSTDLVVTPSSTTCD